MARRSLFFLVIAIAVMGALTARPLPAGVISAKRGVVEKISPDGKTVTVKFSHSEETTDLSVAGEIDVLLDGKHTELTAIKPGMSVTVQVDGTVAQRIIARSVSEGEPKPAKTTKSPKPKPTAKSTAKATTTRKSKQTARKSNKSSKKNDGPNPLDDLPVATTPLAAMNSPARRSEKGAKPAPAGRFAGGNHACRRGDKSLRRHQKSQTGFRIARREISGTRNGAQRRRVEISIGTSILWQPADVRGRQSLPVATTPLAARRSHSGGLPPKGPLHAAQERKRPSLATPTQLLESAV